MKLSIVIPCYDESKNIPLILNRFKEVIEREDIEVVIVDNGSTDDTEKILREMLPMYPFAKSVKVKVNQGYGFGILTGLKAANGEFIGWMHGDMQTDPYDAVKVLEIIEKNGGHSNIYVKGNRKGRSLFDNIFTVGMSIFETLLLGKPLWEINAQPNVFHKSFFEKWDNPPHDFSLDLYAYYLAKKNKLNIIRFEVRFPERIHGASHWNTGLAAKKNFILRTINFSRELRKRLK